MIHYKYTYLIFFFLLFLQSQLFPQTLFENKKDSTYTISYSFDSLKENKITNSIIEEISKSIPKILEYTQVSFNYSIEIAAIDVSKANKKGIKKYNITVKIYPGKPIGDVQYKSFDISEFLIPNETNISLIISENDGSHGHSISQKNILTCTDKTFSTAIAFTDSLPIVNPNIKLEKIQFYYNDSSLVKFKKKTQYINDYYNSEFSIASIQEKLESIDLSYVDLIKIYDIKLKEIEKELAKITSMNYIESLGLYSNDPVGYINKYSTLNVKVKDMRSNINSMLSTLDKVYYDKGIEYILKKDTANALIYFEKSTISNPYYSPAFLQLARIYFYKNNLFSSDQKLINITTKLNPDQSTLKQVIQLADSLNVRFIEKGEAFIAAENYHEALKILNEAKTFCSTVKVISCSETLLKDIAKAKYGIYTSFITVSQKAIDTDKLDIADIYIVKAKDYQIENSQDIISSQEADDLLTQLVKGHTLKGISLNAQLLYDSALTVLQNASDLCKKYSTITCSDILLPAITVSKQGIYKSLIKKAEEYIKINEPAKAEEIIAEAKKYQQENSTEITVAIATDSLSGKMKEKFYQKYISDGISYLKLHEGINALRCFNMAKNLEKKYLITPEKKLDSLINASAKPYVSNYIEKGLVNVWGNEPDKAKAVSDTVKLLLQKYSLAQDSSLQISFTDLETKISALYCKHAGEKYNEYYRNAYQKISLLNYPGAINYFQKCISVVNSNSVCNINNSTAQAGYAKYQNAAKYQKLLSLSDSAAKSGLYDSAIDKYFEAENFSSSINLAEFGLSHTAFDNFIALQNETYLLKASEYFYNKNNIVKTFSCLDIIRKHNFSDSSITAFQNKIAFDLCKTDYLTNPEKKPTELIKKYAVDDSWYLPFKKTYFAYWKELKKKK